MTEKPRILIVEDEVPIQQLLQSRFAKIYEISCATYQNEAFVALENEQFDLVLLDLKLPRHKDDLDPTPDVGVDILRQIRERNIYRRGTEAPLPVVVMTAFGSAKVFTAEFFAHRGACDYVQKPFRDGKALKKKIEVALCGEGAFSAPSSNAIKVVQLRFNTADKVVLVESIQCAGAHYELLAALHELFLQDFHSLKPHESYRGLRSLELAEKWGIEDHAVRQRVLKFRDHVAKQFREQLNRVLDENDIIENLRKWNGYRLNPLVVKPVAWEQEMIALPRRG